MRFPKELVGDMSIVVLMATFPYTPSSKFELSRTILAIPMYLHRQQVHLPVALNPKELWGGMTIAVLSPKSRVACVFRLD